MYSAVNLKKKTKYNVKKKKTKQTNKRIETKFKKKTNKKHCKLVRVLYLFLEQKIITKNKVFFFYFLLKQTVITSG